MSQPSTIDVVGVGLNATDTMLLVPEYPARGAKVESHSVRILPGGQVATAMIACQRWGIRTRYVGKLGDDSAAQVHRNEFDRAGVDTRLITVPSCGSQQSLILVDPEGERTAVGYRDQRLALQPGELKREWIINARALLIDGYDTAAAAQAAEWARTAGIPVIADFDEAYPRIDALLPNIDFLIVSRDFPRRLCGEPHLEQALPMLQHRLKCRLTAATLGSDGVLAWDGSKFHYAPAYRVSVIDTTGAGDVFHAGFIYGLLRDWPLQRQLEFASAAAALNCTAAGARGAIQSVEEIESLMAKRDLHPAAWDVSKMG